MATLNIGGQRVNVGDEFLSLPPDRQQATVDEIASTLGFQKGTQPLADGRAPRSAREAEPSAEQMDAAYEETARGLADRQGTAGSMLRAAGNSIARVVPFADEIAAAGASYLGDQGRGAIAGRSYDENLARIRAYNRVDQEDRPVSAYGPGIAASLALPVVGRSGAGVIEKGATTGAVYGGLYGAGDGNGLAERAANAATGAAVGGTIGAAIPAAIQAPGAAKRYVAGKVGGLIDDATRATPVSEAGGRLGVDVPLMVGSDNRMVQEAAQRARQVPFSGPVIEEGAGKFFDDVTRAKDQVARAISPGGGSTRAAVGGDVTAELEKRVASNKAAQSQNYEDLYKVINPNKPVPLPMGDLNKVITTIEKSRIAAGEAKDFPRELMPLYELATRPQGASFAGLQRARTALSDYIDFEAARGFNVGDLKKGYGALTKALETAAMKAAPKGKQQAALVAFKDADAAFAKLAEVNSDLSGALRSGSESLVDRIIGYGSDKAGANIEKLQFFKQQLGPKFDDVSSLAFQRMGEDVQGNFSPAKLISGWEKMSPEARDVMFAPAHRQAIDDLLTLSKRLDDIGKKYTNYSKTGNQAGWLAFGGGLVTAPLTTIATAMGANYAAKVLTRPMTAKAVAQVAKAQAAHMKAPSPATKALLEKVSQAAGVTLSREFRLPPDVANDLVAQFAGHPRAAADQGNDQ